MEEQKLTTERWWQVKQGFQAAVELPAADSRPPLSFPPPRGRLISRARAKAILRYGLRSNRSSPLTKSRAVSWIPPPSISRRSPPIPCWANL